MLRHASRIRTCAGHPARDARARSRLRRRFADEAAGSNSAAHFIGVDNHAPFVDELNREAQGLGLADRLEARVADMRNSTLLPVHSTLSGRKTQYTLWDSRPVCVNGAGCSSLAGTWPSRRYAGRSPIRRPPAPPSGRGNIQQFGMRLHCSKPSGSADMSWWVTSRCRPRHGGTTTTAHSKRM